MHDFSLMVSFSKIHFYSISGLHISTLKPLSIFISSSNTSSNIQIFAKIIPHNTICTHILSLLHFYLPRIVDLVHVYVSGARKHGGILNNTLENHSYICLQIYPLSSFIPYALQYTNVLFFQNNLFLR